MAHNKNIQMFEAILKHLKMEEEHLKAYTPSNVAFVAKGNDPRVAGLIVARILTRVLVLLKTLALKVGFSRSVRLRALERRI